MQLAAASQRDFHGVSGKATDVGSSIDNLCDLNAEGVKIFHGGRGLL
jgi:hypothetical protein